MSENDILRIEFLKVNGFNVKLKVNVNFYVNVKAYGNVLSCIVLSCINAYIYMCIKYVCIC